MNALTNSVARVLYALPFGVFGILHLMNANAMAGMVPVPGGAFWVYLTGVALIAASLSIIIEWKVYLAGVLLGVLLLIFVFTIHVPAIINAADAMAMQSSLSQLLKDTALAGGAWYIAGRYRGRTADAATSSETRV